MNEICQILFTDSISIQIICQILLTFFIENTSVSYSSLLLIRFINLYELRIIFKPSCITIVWVVFVVDGECLHEHHTITTNKVILNTQQNKYENTKVMRTVK